MKIKSLNIKLIYLLIFLIAAFLRVYNIEQKNLWFDEVFSWHISEGSVRQIVAETSGDIHPPFYYIVLKYWISVFNDSVFSMRMLSVIFGLAAMIFIYRLSERIFSNSFITAGVLLLYSLSPLNIYYSQEVRMLNLNLFLCLGSVYYFYKATDKSGLKNGMMYFAFTVLALYTHYFSLLILFTELLITFLFYFSGKRNIRDLKIFFIYAAAVNIFYAPWYPVFFSQSVKGQPWRTEQTLAQSGMNVIEYFKDVFLSSYYAFENSGIIYFADLTGILIAGFILFSLAFILIRRKKIISETDYLHLFFMVPFMIAVLISLKQSILLSRYLSIIIPYLFFLLLSFSFFLFSKKISYALLVLLILASCIGIYAGNNNNFKNNDYRRIISYIEENFKKGDQIIAEPHFMGWVINYYINHNKTELTPPKILGWNLEMQLDSIRQKKDLNRIWFISDYSSLDKRNYDSLPNLMTDLGYYCQSKKSFYIIPSKVRVDHYIKD